MFIDLKSVENQIQNTLNTNNLKTFPNLPQQVSILYTALFKEQLELDGTLSIS